MQELRLPHVADADHDASRGSRGRLRDARVFVLLVVAGVVWPTFLSTAFCPLTVPRNDAFAYTRVAITLQRTGHLHLVGYGRMSLVGHIALSWPFFVLVPDQQVAGNVFGVVISVLVVVLAYLLARTLLPVGRAALAALLLLIAPGVANTVPTYMTEPTFLAATLATLLLGVLAVRSAHHAALLLTLAAAVGVLSFTVREFGVVAPLAVLVAVASVRRDLRRTAAALVVAVLAGCVAFYAWHQHLFGLEPTALKLNVAGVLRPMLALFTLGFYLLPATLPRLGRLSRAAWLSALPTVVLALLCLASGRTQHKLFSEDMLRLDGVSGQAAMSGVRPRLFPWAAWVPLHALALVGGVVLVAVVVDLVRERARARDELAVLELFTAAYGLGIALYGAAAQQLDDRYLWPLIVPAAIVLLRRREATVGRSADSSRGTHSAVPVPVAVAACCLVLAVTSTVLNQDVAAYDGASWAVSTSLVEAGVPPDQIDGGLDWAGAHSSVLADLSTAAHDAAPLPRPYYAGFWPPTYRCLVVSNSPLAGAELVTTRSYRSQLGLRSRHLFVSLHLSPGCRRLTQAARSVR